MAFQRLQSTLAAKDLELAKLQQAHGDVVSELVELRRVKKRENINMDYLKNVVFQVLLLHSHMWNAAHIASI